jgi:hypothetical protein
VTNNEAQEIAALAVAQRRAQKRMDEARCSKAPYREARDEFNDASEAEMAANKALAVAVDALLAR